MIYISFPALLKRKEELIEERKYFFKKYYCREESELLTMFSKEDLKKWNENKTELHETTTLIEDYRRDCKDRGMECL